MRPHLQILVVFKEPVARRILFQALRKERHPLEQPVPDGQLQHPAERGGLPIDGGGFGALFASVQLLAAHGVGRDRLGPVAAEDLPQMFGAPGEAGRFQRVQFPPRQGE